MEVASHVSMSVITIYRHVQSLRKVRLPTPTECRVSNVLEKLKEQRHNVIYTYVSTQLLFTHF